jgi:hypothetical protein
MTESLYQSSDYYFSPFTSLVSIPVASIDALHTAHALTISFVAEIGSRVVDHIAFSPVTIVNR